MKYIYLEKNKLEPPQPHSRTDISLLRVEQNNLIDNRSMCGKLKKIRFIFASVKNIIKVNL